MQKQIVKGITMLMLVAGVALMAALVSAYAQSPGSIVADVPFDFTVGSKSLKAGEYSVRAFTKSGNTVLISNKDRSDVAVRLWNSIQVTTPQEAKLVFHRYGQRYFLSEVWNLGEQTGRQLVKSREERALETQLAANSSKSEVARNSYETVEILAMIR